MKKYSSALLIAFCVAAGANAADEAASADALKAAMGTEQYEAAGLDKLSEAERAALYRWLESQGNIISPPPPGPAPEAAAAGAATATAAATAAPIEAEASRPPQDPESFGFPEPEPDELEGREELLATILPPFTGWKGKTYFKLDNGQIWQQRRSGRFVYRGDDLRVKIYKNAFGFYDLRLIDADRAVGVKRVR